MKKTNLKINGIPSILWGETSERLYIFVHGKLSCKEDAADFAEIACKKGYQVLSFDLPEHGQRKDEGLACDVWNGIKDLQTVGFYVLQGGWKEIFLFANSLGAYFSLLAYTDYPFKSCLFLSPILNMERLIQNMLLWSHTGEQELEEKGLIPTEFGETLDWRYYTYVKEHPIKKWDVPTCILYPSADHLTERNVVDAFVSEFRADLVVFPNGEHWFHTEEQLAFLRQWLEEHIT